MSILEVQNFRKSFGETEVLKGVDFTLEKGQVLVIIGSSGSGKTTLLRCLTFLEKPDEGTMWVGGEELLSAPWSKKVSDEEIRQKRSFWPFKVLEGGCGRELLSRSSLPQAAP